jgi:hypothetical protein
MDYVPGETMAAKPRRPLLPLLILPLIAFLLGLAAMGWLLSRWDRGAALLGIAPQGTVEAGAPPPAPQLSVERQPAPDLGDAPADAQRLVIDPEITRRVNLVEERLAQLDLQSRAAVGNADRAEGLLVAFAARRALDRGVGLGYIEGLLRQRFAQTQPQAVATVLTAARQPVTLQELQDGLQDIAPKLVGGGPEQSFWAALKTELGGLVSIRRADTPTTLPSERLRRAGRRLEAGQVEVALAEVLRLPGREGAAEWIGKARRYVAARKALDLIESAALLEPRGPMPTGAPAAAAPRPAAPATAGPSGSGRPL